MEFGNICFGNSRGEVSLDRDTISGVFGILWTYVRSDQDFKNKVFSIYPYYWGNCTCGYEQKEYEFSDTLKHAEGCYQTELKKVEKWFDSKGINYSDKRRDKVLKNLCLKYDIPWDEGFGCLAHCTCDYKTKWNEFISNNSHNGNCLTVLPNFHHFESDYKIKWYKYPFRDSYANKDLTEKQIAEIVLDCIKSLTGN